MNFVRNRRDDLPHFMTRSMCKFTVKHPCQCCMKKDSQRSHPRENSKQYQKINHRKVYAQRRNVNPQDMFRWHFLHNGMVSLVCTTATGSFGRGRSSKAQGGAAWAWIWATAKLEPIFIELFQAFLVKMEMQNDVSKHDFQDFSNVQGGSWNDMMFNFNFKVERQMGGCSG